MTTMQSLSDDERKLVLGEVLADELRVIREYVEEVPALRAELREVHIKVDEIDERLIVVEHVVKAHERNIQLLLARVS